MDLNNAHILLTMLEMLEDGWEYEEHLTRDDDTIGVVLSKEDENGLCRDKVITFERRAM